jgi:hypothetical protein
LIRSALKKCVDNATGLLQRDDKAVEAVFEGLVIGGVAMAYAGVSRPASGVEHYFSHVWDMRGLEFGTQVDLHGIQCAVATLQAVKLYERIKEYKPDAEKAMAYVDNFSYETWKEQLRAFLGNSAETMIAQETKEGKYNKETHPARFALVELCNVYDEGIEFEPIHRICFDCDPEAVLASLQEKAYDPEGRELRYLFGGKEGTVKIRNASLGSLIGEVQTVLDEWEQKGSPVDYIHDDKALEKYRKTHKGDFTLQRYKGLGEMDADQLWETTLCPETRILKQVEIEDGRMASQITSMLMGSEVAPRRVFIHEHAQDAEVDV